MTVQPGRSLRRYWTDRPLAFKGLVVVGLPLTILLGALVSLYLASNAEAQAEDNVRRAFAIQRDAYQVHALLAEAAAGVRGYALTREERFLDPYRKAEADLPQTMQRLDGAIRDPVVRSSFEELNQLAGRKREGLRRIVQLAEQARSPGSGNPRIAAALGSNKIVLDAMRRAIDDLQRRERVLLSQRMSRVEEVRDRFLALTAVSAVVGLLGSLTAVYLFSTGIVRRVRMLERNAGKLARGEPLADLRRAREAGTAEDEGWRVRKDGSRFWANVVITALRDEHGVLRGFAKVTRDMSERRRSEDALRGAREEAIAANHAKSAFLSRTSHELRTPMSAILGFGQLLELDAEELPERNRAAVQQIMKAGRHLLSLINDLLDISSIEAGGMDLVVGPLDLEEVLEEVYGLAMPIVASGGLVFELESSRDLAAVGDRRRVVQVILNLVANAAKYHRTGTRVRLSCRRVESFIRIEVEDDGSGIRPEDVPRLFTAFDRLGQQERTKADGTGLGLALSKSLVESMGGTIGFEAPGHGARFWFTLPAAPCFAAPAEAGQFADNEI
jgi:signal transduction histidine kinase